MLHLYHLGEEGNILDVHHVGNAEERLYVDSWHGDMVEQDGFFDEVESLYHLDAVANIRHVLAIDNQMRDHLQGT